MKNRALLYSVLVIGLIVAVGLFYQYSNHISSPRCIIWRTGNSVCYSKLNTKVLEYQLDSKSGEVIPFPAFTVRQDMLAYYSPADKAVCLVPKFGPLQWISVARFVSANSEAVSLVSSRDDLYVNYYVSGSTPFVVKLPLTSRSGSVTRLAKVLEVSAKPSSPSVAIRSELNEIQVGSFQDNLFVNLVHRVPQSADYRWDCDPADKVVCWFFNNKIVIQDSRHKKAFSVIWPCWPRTVTLQPSIHQIWVSVSQPADIGFKILLYSYNGKYLGIQSKNNVPIQKPIQPVDNSIAKILDRLPKAL